MTMPKGWKQEKNANLGPKKEYGEDKRWIVDRIEYYLQGALEEALTEKDSIVKKLTENYPKAIDRRRNQILAAIGFVVTLLVSLKDFEQAVMFKDWLLIAVIISLSCGVTVFLVLSELSKRSSKAINQIEVSYIDFVNRINTLKGFLASSSLYLDKLTIQQLDTLYGFIVICTCNKIELAKDFTKTSSMYLFRADKGYLIERIRDCEEVMKKGYDTYQLRKENINQEKNLGGLMGMVQPLISRYEQV